LWITILFVIFHPCYNKKMKQDGQVRLIATAIVLIAIALIVLGYYYSTYPDGGVKSVNNGTYTSENTPEGASNDLGDAVSLDSINDAQASFEVGLWGEVTAISASSITVRVSEEVLEEGEKSINVFAITSGTEILEYYDKVSGKSLKEVRAMEGKTDAPIFPGPDNIKTRNVSVGTIKRGGNVSVVGEESNTGNLTAIRIILE
jgi:hypothetical protein